MLNKKLILSVLFGIVSFWFVACLSKNVVYASGVHILKKTDRNVSVFSSNNNNNRNNRINYVELNSEIERNRTLGQNNAVNFSSVQNSLYDDLYGREEYYDDYDNRWMEYVSFGRTYPVYRDLSSI